MRLRLLLIGILALTLFGSVSAAGNRTLACSASGAVSGCWIEQPVYVLGPLEIAVGVDAQVAYDGLRTSFLAPYVVLGWYASAWSAWAEFAIPETPVPTLGKPDAWRLGFRVRF